jgi:hypothetical protein
MPGEIEALLLRNLHEVFGETDAGRRRAAVDALFAADCVFVAPDGRHEGRAAVAAAAGAIQALFPTAVYSVLAPPDAIDGVGRLAWASGPPEMPRAVTGMDIIVVQDGRIAALYTFLDPTPR